MISIVGRGNVASHLLKALSTYSETVLVNPRTLEDLPEKSDIILISVSDNAIEEVAAKLPDTEAVVAHTAGSVPMKVLDRFKNHGVFYPLQTFTKDIPLHYGGIPVFIEGNSPETEKKLKETASMFSGKVCPANSVSRKKLHLASVFACNFTNALATISAELLKETDIDFQTVLPLMRQTIDKLQTLPPDKAQTGPAVRGDYKVMADHLKMLSDRKDLKSLYLIFSNLISDRLKHHEI